jgi:hypothetical protein
MFHICNYYTIVYTERLNSDLSKNFGGGGGGGKDGCRHENSSLILLFAPWQVPTSFNFKRLNSSSIFCIRLRPLIKLNYVIMGHYTIHRPYITTSLNTNIYHNINSVTKMRETYPSPVIFVWMNLQHNLVTLIVTPHR